jgi:transposase
MRNRPIGAVIYGVDLGKNRFDVVACDAMGKPMQRLKLTRHSLLPFFGQVGKALIGMEACPGAQWLARMLSEMGHSVRIIPAQFVKPFVKSNKNDARDAEAIVEALIRPTMRFAEVKSTPSSTCKHSIAFATGLSQIGRSSSARSVPFASSMGWRSVKVLVCSRSKSQASSRMRRTTSRP